MWRHQFVNKIVLWKIQNCQLIIASLIWFRISRKKRKKIAKSQCACGLDVYTYLIVKLYCPNNKADKKEQGMLVHRQDNGKVFVFKMSVDRPESGVDLVKRMQPGGDLQDCWIMFDHVKRVASWTTIVCQVYDNKYCKVMTIALCDMQSQDAEAQELFWVQLNRVMRKNVVKNTNFNGFMADRTGANWHVVQKVYDSGDPYVPMEDRVRTCLFHWTKCLQQKTSRHILLGFQDQYIIMCKGWKNSRRSRGAVQHHSSMVAILTEEGRRTLNDWWCFGTSGTGNGAAPCSWYVSQDYLHLCFAKFCF